MSELWASKSPTAIVERTWAVPTADNDSLATFTASPTGVIIDAEESNGDIITLTLSGGSQATTPTVEFTATTTNGLVITKTFYQPIRIDGFRNTPTARAVCEYALRKVVGNGADADAVELDDALERLENMLSDWAGEGADLEVVLPVVANNTLSIPEWSVGAVKDCLTARVHDFYEIPQTPDVAMSARRGLQRVKSRLLPDEREGVEFY